MKIFVTPVGLHSRAMVRVAEALRRHAPPGVSFTDDPAGKADLRVLHLIDYPISEPDGEYAVIQYCLKTSRRPNVDDWSRLWSSARAVWSYYEEPGAIDGVNFYHAPLGLDEAFVRGGARERRRTPLFVTTGYVSDPKGEAIEEVWTAAARSGIRGIHIGPHRVYGIDRLPMGWHSTHGISDGELADIYSESSWVAALRHVEGFEMPGIEGLACGARPIVFDQPAMRRWYGDSAEYVPECSGEGLVQRLASIFGEGARPVTEEERSWARGRFDWSLLARGFWDAVFNEGRQKEEEIA